MSKQGDFLSGFSGRGEKKPLTEQNTSPVKDTNSTTEVKEKVNIAENKKLADKIVAESQGKVNTPKRNNTSVGIPNRPAQSTNAIIKAPEHIVTKDEKFHKQKMVRYGIIGTVTIVIVVLGFFLIRMLNSVEVPDFTGEEIANVEIWALRSNVTVEQDREFSLDYDEGIVIGQNREPGSSMSRNSVISFTVSDGPNMDEVIVLPDFEEMTGAAIRTWRSNYHMNAINIREENSSEIEANYVIRIDVPSTVDIEYFRRSDSLNIYISSGPETVTINNMIGNNREQVDEFIERNPSIEVEIEYEPNETILRGTVLRQSHAPNARLAVGDTFILTLSEGNPVSIPNFANIIPTEAAEEGQRIGLTVIVRERYHPTVPFGRLISQSEEAGSNLFGDEPMVEAVYSLGRPWISQLSSEFEIVQEMFGFNSRGASLTHTITHVDSYLPRGSVVSQSRYNQFVALNDHINFQISLGNLEPPADLQLPMPDLPSLEAGDDGED